MAAFAEKDVLDAIQDALGLEAGQLTIDTTTQDIKEWDSIGHLGVLTKLDKLFDGKVAAIQELADADSLQKIVVILREHSLID